METAMLLKDDDLRKLIREAIRTELNLISRSTPQEKPEPQEGGVDFALGVLGVYSRSTLYKLTSEGAIPHTKRGRTLWFKRSELEKWLEDGATIQKR